jgi:hypothetical protein
MCSRLACRNESPRVCQCNQLHSLTGDDARSVRRADATLAAWMTGKLIAFKDIWCPARSDIWGLTALFSNWRTVVLDLGVRSFDVEYTDAVGVLRAVKSPRSSR